MENIGIDTEKIKEKTSKVVRIRVDLLSQLDKYSNDTNEAIELLLQECNKREVNDYLSNPNTKKELEKALVSVSQLKLAVKTHTEEIIELQDTITRLTKLNGLRAF